MFLTRHRSDGKPYRIFERQLRPSHAYLIDRLQFPSSGMGMFNRSATCPICGHSFLSDIEPGGRLVGTSPTGMFLDPHLQASHPDFVAWRRTIWKRSIILGIAVGLAIDGGAAYVLFLLGIRTVRGYNGILYYGGVPPLIILGFPIAWWFLNRWGIRRFRREWNMRGGVPAPQTDSSQMTAG
jgi:hypothetical protein